MKQALATPGAKLGVWEDGGKWYIDVSETVPGRLSAANATINRGEKAAWNQTSHPRLSGETFVTAPYVSDPAPKFIPERKRRAMINAETAGLPEQLAQKESALASEPRPTFPNKPEYWPWQIDRGGYKLQYNKPEGDRGEGHYSVNRVQSADEKKLAKKVKQAEADTVWKAQAAVH